MNIDYKSSRYAGELLAYRILLVAVVMLCLSGCQTGVYLMPSPVGLNPGNELFDIRDDNKDDNLLYTLYATNRVPLGEIRKGELYAVFPWDTLSFGYVVHRVGDEPMSWEEIYHLSLAPEREKDLLLVRQFVRETFQVDIGKEKIRLSPQADGYFDQINRTLEKSLDKDILIYVHGANSSFDRATAQGAQYFHFTGHNSLVLTFCWPSAESLLRYGTDVKHGRKAVPAFSRLIELLAENTQARNINILAYSAGARVVAQGLAELVAAYQDEPVEQLRSRLRIGEVYFAAPDTGFKPFLDRYLFFRNIVYRTTINLNRYDSVLRWASFRDGMSRLGRPDVSELDEQQTNALLAAMRGKELNILDIGGSESLLAGGAHNSWYNHPWVSMDVLLLMLFNADPVERGLVEHWLEGKARVFRFPEGYDVNLPIVLEKNREELEKKMESRSSGRPLE